MKRDRNCLMFLNYTKDYQYSHLSFVFVCLLTVLRESLYVSQNFTHTVDLPRNNRKKNINESMYVCCEIKHLLLTWSNKQLIYIPLCQLIKHARSTYFTM